MTDPNTTKRLTPEEILKADCAHYLRQLWQSERVNNGVGSADECCAGIQTYISHLEAALSESTEREERAFNAGRDTGNNAVGVPFVDAFVYPTFQDYKIKTKGEA